MAHRTLALTFLATLAILALTVFAFGGAVPEFPFKNLAQLEGMPGLKGEAEHSVLPCLGRQVARARLRDEAGEIVWQVFVEIGGTGTHLTAGYYGQSIAPQTIYIGTYNSENGAITINSVRPYDPKTDFTPCDSWGVET